MSNGVGPGPGRGGCYVRFGFWSRHGPAVTSSVPGEMGGYRRGYRDVRFHAWVRGIAGRIIFAFPDRAFKKIWGFGHENPAWDLIINYVIKIGIYPR